MPTADIVHVGHFALRECQNCAVVAKPWVVTCDRRDDVLLACMPSRVAIDEPEVQAFVTVRVALVGPVVVAFEAGIIHGDPRGRRLADVLDGHDDVVVRLADAIDRRPIGVVASAFPRKHFVAETIA